jgi:tetratricopeptide (TPR) repeat protein
MMRIDLIRGWPRIFFLATVLLCAGILTFFSGKAYIAERWNASAKPGLWLQTVRLEPGNAEYWRHLGLYRQWDLSPGGIYEAQGDLQRATQIDPRSADLWMELADAYQSSGDLVRAQEAYGNAEADYPISAEVAWRYGSFLLYERNFAQGYTEIRKALVLDPALVTSAISECWQSNQDVVPVLDNLLPAKSAYYVNAIDFFLSQNLADPALAVWNRQLSLGLPVKVSDAIPLVDALIDQNRMAEAQQVWQRALRAANWPSDSSRSKSLVFNGQFDHDITNGGFDWREPAVSGALFDFDGQIAHSASRSFRIRFDGTQNLDFQNLFQYVVVQPLTRYRFSAYVRTEELSTDSGIRFEILDPRHPSQVQLVTSNVTGTNPWTLVEADLVTGAGTNLLKITLRRIPSWKFDNKLRGTVWVGDVALTPVEVPRKDSSG